MRRLSIVMRHSHAQVLGEQRHKPKRTAPFVLRATAISEEVNTLERSTLALEMTLVQLNEIADGTPMEVRVVLGVGAEV